VSTYLDDIVAYHRQRAGADRRSTDEVMAELATAPEPRDFAGALRARSGRLSPSLGPGSVAVIAEVKRRSPSKGDLAADLDPATTALAYAAGGASCLSVLTDGPHFSGSPADLAAARTAVNLPALRKDFTVSANDVVDTRAMGADAVLLIAAMLDDDELASFRDLAGRIGLAALVEVHDEAECARALRAGATLIGINQRDLHSFAVDTDRALRVASHLPDSVVRVAESGIRTRADVERLTEAGFDAVLVGEALVTDGDPARAVERLAGGVRCS
jgi:indole-3-glycerol phosphate synthase